MPENDAIATLINQSVRDVKRG